MRVSFLLMVTLFVIVATSCTAIPTPTPVPTSTPLLMPPTKQPEPQRPLVGGRISGLPDGTLATIYVRLPSGRVVLWGQRGNGSWEFVVTDVGGAEKIVAAEAEGYVSTPISYTIHLSSTTAYVVESGRITTNEALHLDFHFAPAGSP